MTTVWTDGSCNAEGVIGRGGWAALIERDGTTDQLVGSAVDTTHNRMELTAVCEALEQLSGAIEVRTDSTYIEKCFNDGWHIRWLQDDKWRTAKGPVKNRDLWERLFALVEDETRDVSWAWVPRGTEANNKIVDRLSREASKSHAENIDASAAPVSRRDEVARMTRYWLCPRGTEDDPLPANWFRDDAWRRENTDGFGTGIRGTPAIRTGDQVVWYAVKWRVVYGLAEVIGDPEQRQARAWQRDRWPWFIPTRTSVVVPDLSRAPRLDDVGLPWAGVRSYRRLSRDQFETCSRELARVGELYGET